MITHSNIHTAWQHRGRAAALVAAMAALSVATLGFASAAGAAGNVPRLEKPSGIEAASASTYLAGYQVSPSGGLASASVTFTVPTITACTAANAIQLDGVYTNTFNSFALVQTSCPGPLYQYIFATEAGTKGGEGGVAPGDVVVTSLFQSESATSVEIHDLTNGAYWFDQSRINQRDTNVDIGTLSWTSYGLPVPTFTKVKFTNATVNGDYLGFDSLTRYNAFNGGDLVIKSGALTTSATGSSFSDKFKAAS
jgi:hypothetical protein